MTMIVLAYKETMDMTASSHLIFTSFNQEVLDLGCETGQLPHRMHWKLR